MLVRCGCRSREVVGEFFLGREWYNYLLWIVLGCCRLTIWEAIFVFCILGVCEGEGDEGIVGGFCYEDRGITLF